MRMVNEVAPVVFAHHNLFWDAVPDVKSGAGIRNQSTLHYVVANMAQVKSRPG